MSIGRKMGSRSAFKAAIKKGSGAGVQGIPTEGIRVRFLTEPEEWVGYGRYWDADAKRYVPLLDGEVVPEGCRFQERFVARSTSPRPWPRSSTSATTGSAR
jgi:hypothetical protein